MKPINRSYAAGLIPVTNKKIHAVSLLPVTNEKLVETNSSSDMFQGRS